MSHTSIPSLTIYYRSPDGDIDSIPILGQDDTVLDTFYLKNKTKAKNKVVWKGEQFPNEALSS
jgi:hypothetical protein